HSIVGNKLDEGFVSLADENDRVCRCNQPTRLGGAIERDHSECLDIVWRERAVQVDIGPSQCGGESPRGHVIGFTHSAAQGGSAGAWIVETHETLPAWSNRPCDSRECNDLAPASDGACGRCQRCSES